MRTVVLCDPNGRFGYEDWMNDLATRFVDLPPTRTVTRWRGRTFVYWVQP